MNRSRQKINKKTLALNNTLDQINLMGIYRTFYPKAGEYINFSLFILYSHTCPMEIPELMVKSEL